MNQQILDFLDLHIGLRFKISKESNLPWYATFENKKGQIVSIENGNSVFEASTKALHSAQDVLTVTDSRRILYVGALMKDPDGYFQIHTQHDIDLGALTIRELKNYAEWNQKFWSFVHNGFVFHCGPDLHKTTRISITR